MKFSLKLITAKNGTRMKKKDDDYKNWLTVFRKWLRHNIAFSVMIGVIGFLVSTYQFYDEDHLKPREAYWLKVKQILADTKTKAVVISDLCEGFSNSADKVNLLIEIRKINNERRELTDQLVNDKFDNSRFSENTIKLLKGFIQMNYKDYLFITKEGKCPDRVMPSKDIESMEDEIQKSIQHDMGWILGPTHFRF